MKNFLSTIALAMVSFYSVAEPISSIVTEPISSVDKDIETSVCSSTVHSGLNYFLNTWDLAVPILGEATKQIFDDACPDEDKLENDKLRKEFNARIDDLSDKVDSLDERLTAVGLNITAAVSDLYNLQSLNDIDTFDTQLAKFDSYYDKYQGILNDSNYNFLKEIIVSNNKNDQLSTFKKLYNTSEYFKLQFINTGDIISAFTRILGGSSARSLKQALDGMCLNQGNITDDIILTRKKCNNILTYMAVNVTSRMLNAKLMLNDIIQTELVVEQSLRDDIDGWFKLGGLGYDMRKFNNNNTLWADASAKVNVLIDTHFNLIQSTLIGTNNGNFYKSFDDFPINIMNLRASMKQAECDEQIEKWYSQVALNQPFIVIGCRQNPYHYVTTKYYLNGGENVKNIFGSLVPANAKRLYSEAIKLNYSERQDFEVYWSAEPTSYIATVTRFNLKSDLPLSINPNLAPRYGRLGMMQEEDKPYVRSEASMPLYPIYYNTKGISNEFTKAFAEAGKPSLLLDTVGVDEKEFKSSVRNIALHSADPAYMVETTEHVFLGFEMNGFAYAFGLRIHNAGGLLKTNFLGEYFEFLKGYEPSEDLSLICLAGTECKIEGKQVIWNDGTYVSMSGNGNNISLSFGKKPNGSK